MKKSLLIFLPLVLLLACNKSEDLPKKSCYEEVVNQELIHALTELNMNHLYQLVRLQEIYEDKTEPRISSRAKGLYDKIDLSYGDLNKTFEKIKSKTSINDREKLALIQECQNFTIDLTEVVFGKKLPSPSTIIDSNKYFLLYDTLLANHEGQSYDTVLFYKLARDYYKAWKIIDHCEGVKSSKNELQLLLAQQFMLNSMNTVIMWRLSGCYAPYATSDIKVYTERLNKEINTDSLTLKLNIAFVLDVDATHVFVEGLPGRGWVENENYYYRVEDKCKDSIIKGRIGMRNKSGEVRFRDFESKVYN